MRTPGRNADGRTPEEQDALDRWARRNDEDPGLPDDLPDDTDPDGGFMDPGPGAPGPLCRTCGDIGARDSGALCPDCDA